MNRDISQMLSCWSSNVIEQNLGKYMDNEQSSCAFHWSHRGCNKYQWNSMVKKASRESESQSGTQLGTNHGKKGGYGYNRGKNGAHGANVNGNSIQLDNNLYNQHKKVKNKKMKKLIELQVKEQQQRNNPIGATRIKNNRNRMHIGIPLVNALAKKVSKYNESESDFEDVDSTSSSGSSSNNGSGMVHSNYPNVPLDTSSNSYNRYNNSNSNSNSNSNLGITPHFQLPIHASDVKFTPNDIMELGGEENMYVWGSVCVCVDCVYVYVCTYIYMHIYTASSVTITNPYIHIHIYIGVFAIIATVVWTKSK